MVVKGRNLGKSWRAQGWRCHWPRRIWQIQTDPRYTLSASGLPLALRQTVGLIQGFIYWGGGSRRFIYDPEKLNPDAPTWMANKFQSAMPGALLGTDHLIAFLLHHFWLLYPAVILFSGTELIAGAALMAGLLTRLAALVSVGFSLVLMLMFGWQGGTCIDEWTMAACNLATGATLMLAGGGAYSLDNVLLKRSPRLADRAWLRWLAGSLPLPLADTAFRNLGLAVLAAVLAFDIGTYSYYRGSVLTPYHGGPVSPARTTSSRRALTVSSPRWAQWRPLRCRRSRRFIRPRMGAPF